MKKKMSKPNISSIRTRNLLINALFTLLEQKPFSNIFVKDICEIALVPRATFYNHFEDKYDLLTYSLEQLEKKLEPASNREYSSNDYYFALLSNVADYCIKNKISLKKINQLNTNNMFFNELQNHLASQLLNHIITSNKKKHLLRVPPEVLAEYYAGAFLAMIKWWINDDRHWTKDELLVGADILLNRKQDLYY